MAARRLGRQGPLVSTIGFGAFKIGRNQQTKYAGSYDLPDDAQVDRLLNEMLDAGITYIDTAPAYGASEAQIGRALAHRRREFVLSSKVGETFADGLSHYDYSRAAIVASVERSLQQLRSEALDLLLIHSDGNDLGILHHSDAVETLLGLKQRGLALGIGLSAKSAEGAAAALEWADAIMVEYHLLDRSQEPVIVAAEHAGVGVVVKKGLAAGQLAANQAIPFVLANSGVASLVVGSLSMEHLRENLRFAGTC